jgi:hypothetical protein
MPSVAIKSIMQTAVKLNVVELNIVAPWLGSTLVCKYETRMETSRASLQYQNAAKRFYSTSPTEDSIVSQSSCSCVVQFKPYVSTDQNYLFNELISYWVGARDTNMLEILSSPSLFKLV